jgi:hypothetical protein
LGEGFRLSKKYYFFDKGVCGLTTVRTFAGREVFSPTHMSPEKMIGLSFAAAAAKLYEVFGQAKPSPQGEGFAFSCAARRFG